jgi:rubredoxin-NAD+ reductase
MKRIVIVGTGMAGYMLAQSIRQVSGEVSITLVAERDGRFYPKPMLSTALYHHKSPQDMVTASAAEMAKQYKLEVKTETKVTKIEVVEKKVFCENGEVIGYDNLVLATGSSARHLREDKERCCYSINSIEDYERLLLALQDKKRVLIIGSGLVGVEFAHDLLQAGYEVSLFSQEVVPLSGLVPEEIGGVCKQHLLSLGLNWLPDDSIAEIIDKSGMVEVGFAKQRRETFDVVISAIGIRAETDLARSIGLVVDQGIVTDEYGQTSQEGVFAIGDCAQIYGLNLTYVAPIRQQAKAIWAIVIG